MKTHVLAFGRMSPISSGHEHLVNKVSDVAKEHDADHTIVLSKTQDGKKNPLHIDDKVKFAKKYFPKANIIGATKEHATFLQHAKKLHDSGVEHLVMVAGSDRVKEYHDKLHEYNGKPDSYNFKKISVVSAGDRDPDAEGISGMSATKLRSHAAAGEFDKFKSGLPHGTDETHREMYHAVRRGLKVESFISNYSKMIRENRGIK